MKNLYILLLFCFFSTSFFAQELPLLIKQQYPQLTAMERNIDEGDNTPIPEEYLLSADRRSNWDEYELEWMLNDSTEYSYNAAGNYDEIISYFLNENIWEPNRRNLFFYDDNQQMTIYKEQSWVDGEWGQAEGDSQDLRTYDELGNQTELIYQNWIDGEWKTNFKLTNTYYEGTDLLESELYQSDYEYTGELINETYYLYEEYNSNGDLEIWTQQYWDTYTMEWDNKSIFERTYNGDNQLVLELQHEEINGMLNPKFQIIYTYNNEGFLQERLNQRWENFNEEWIDYLKNVYEYNEDGNWTLYESYYFDSYTQELIISFQLVFTYFDHGGYDQYIVRANQGEGLINDARYTFTYYEDFLEQKTYIREFWDQDLNTWENNFFVEYFYDFFVDTDEQLLKDEKAIYLFPNPARDQVNLQLNNLALMGNAIHAQLYNQQGQVVRQYTLGQESHQIDVAGLPTGSYLLKVSNGEQFTVKKLIIK